MERRRAEDGAIAAAFGDRLRAVRHQHQMTQEQLAEAAGLHVTFVSNLERGYRVPTLATVVRVADALEMRLGELLDAMET